MKEQILSRSRLQPIIERFNLYGNDKMSMDDRIDAVRKNIDVRPIESTISRTGGLPGFTISYQASDPRTAQLVCGEITSLFINENLSDRTAAAEGTTAFLQAQLADAKAKLDDQDAQLARFQEQYAGRLPDQEAANLNMLTTLNTQLDATTQALARMEQDKSYEQAMLAQQTAAQSSGSGSALAPGAQQQQLEKLESQEAELTARYTDDYPDVVAVKRKIKELRAAMAKAPAPTAAAVPPSTAPNRSDSLSVQQLRAQLRALDQGIAQKRRDQASLTAQIRGYQGRISSTPAVQEQYKKITRDHQTAQQFYDDLLNRMNQAKMGTDLEKRQQGENFRVMDEPNLPDKPTFPNRIAFAAGGFAFGLALGLLIAAFLEYRDTAVRSERDIWAFTNLPTLAVIGFTGDMEAPATKRKWPFRRNRPDITAGAKPLMNAGS